MGKGVDNNLNLSSGSYFALLDVKANTSESLGIGKVGD